MLLRRMVGIAVLSTACLVAPMAAVPMAGQAASDAEPMAFGFKPENTRQATLLADEAAIGRKFAYTRVYEAWNDTWPDANANFLESTGHSLFLSIKAKLKNGTNIKYTQISAAQPGSSLYNDMVRWANAIKGYNGTIYVSFNHEPDTSPSQPSGTAPQFIAAYRKFVDVMRAQNVTNAKWAFTTATRNYSVSPSNPKYAPAYYPGDQWVDVIALDAYNMYCRTQKGTFAYPWRSLETLIAPFMTFVAQHPGPDLVMAEWGSAEDPANGQRKAQWITDAREMFKKPAYERFVGISYWNELSHNYEGCDFRVASSAASLNAFKAMANDPFYAGTV